MSLNYWAPKSRWWRIMKSKTMWNQWSQSKFSKQNFLQLRYFSCAFCKSTCRSWHNHINTMRFELSNSVHSMLIQPFYTPILSLSFFTPSISLNVSAQVSLITQNKIHPERWQSLRWSRKPSLLQNQKLIAVFKRACSRTFTWARTILQTK